jgi:tetratricopeptide (TPR) repeat protein
LGIISSDRLTPLAQININEVTSYRGLFSWEQNETGRRTFFTADYQNLFNRVSINLGAKESDIALTTDELLKRYNNGTQSVYLEMLLFQYGRYLLISSSRDGSLPANLQGVWNTYNMPAWACDYTHNINVEMNYWPAFSTNLAETFKAYVDYNSAYMKQAELKKAKNELINAVTLNKNIPEVHYNLAYIYNRLGKTKIAQSYLDNYNKLVENN